MGRQFCRHAAEHWREDTGSQTQRWNRGEMTEYSGRHFFTIFKHSKKSIISNDKTKRLTAFQMHQLGTVELSSLAALYHTFMPENSPFTVAELSEVALPSSMGSVLISVFIWSDAFIPFPPLSLRWFISTLQSLRWPFISIFMLSSGSDFMLSNLPFVAHGGLSSS